jgi:hypothetical protein
MGSFQGINELLTAGIAITAFSLLLYALTFNLRDRVAQSFALILFCVVIVSTCDAIASSLSTAESIAFWLKMEWIGIIFLPPAYVHFSDALLDTTGRPSRGRRRRFVQLTYLFALVFFIALVVGKLVGPIILHSAPAPHLERTQFTTLFSIFYLTVVLWAWINLWRAYQRTVTSTSRRRMRYLLIGAVGPILGTYPFLLFGIGLAQNHPLIFWIAATLSNLLVSILLVLMAYAVAFFGVSWPDRVVKRRLFKWLMRGPVTAIIVLAITTFFRRFGSNLGLTDPIVIPIVMVVTLLIMEHLITLVAPIWERWLFHGGDPEKLELVQSLEERLLTTGDLRDFLESVLAAVCDRLQVGSAFVVTLGSSGLEMLLTIGEKNPFEGGEPQVNLLQEAKKNGNHEVNSSLEKELFIWSGFWLVPLFQQDDESSQLLGFIGAERKSELSLENDQIEALFVLANRAGMALKDIQFQQQVFTSLEALQPQVDRFQRLRAAARYDGTEVLIAPELDLEDQDISKWVKDALSHYWGGPKLSQSPLMHLQIVQHALETHDSNPTNALRSILLEAIQRVRPEGERRFTGEWILYNILEMKFLEGKKVREIAMRLAMSEADLYR